MKEYAEDFTFLPAYYYSRSRRRRRRRRIRRGRNIIIRRNKRRRRRIHFTKTSQFTLLYGVCEDLSEIT